MEFYAAEIYPENRSAFAEVIDREIDFPAEFGYGLVANKWFFKEFAGKISKDGTCVEYGEIDLFNINVGEINDDEEIDDFINIDLFNQGNFKGNYFGPTF